MKISWIEIIHLSNCTRISLFFISDLKSSFVTRRVLIAKASLAFSTSVMLNKEIKDALITIWTILPKHCEEIIQSFYFAWCLLQLKWKKKSTEDNRLSRDISRHCNCWRDLWFRILFGLSVVKPKPKFITTTNQHFSF